jgi:hypothetical protein
LKKVAPLFQNISINIFKKKSTSPLLFTSGFGARRGQHHPVAGQPRELVAHDSGARGLAGRGAYLYGFPYYRVVPIVSLAILIGVVYAVVASLLLPILLIYFLLGCAVYINQVVFFYFIQLTRSISAQFSLDSVWSSM